MRQKLLTIVAAASLVLSAATAILWVRSYWRADVIGFHLFRADDGGTIIRKRRDAGSSGARLVVSMSTTQMIPERHPGTFVFQSREPRGWSFGVFPAPYRFALMGEPQFDALGLRVAWRWGRETDMKNYFPRGPIGKVRTSDMSLAVPHWMVVLMGLMAPTWWFLRRRKLLLRLGRVKQGLCVSCGYDLRASPHDGRCPECGAVPAVPLTAAGAGGAAVADER
jgi:hypothetical protein